MSFEQFEKRRRQQCTGDHDPFHAERGHVPGGRQIDPSLRHFDGHISFGSPFDANKHRERHHDHDGHHTHHDRHHHRRRHHHSRQHHHHHHHHHSRHHHHGHHRDHSHAQNSPDGSHPNAGDHERQSWPTNAENAHNKHVADQKHEKLSKRGEHLEKGAHISGIASWYGEGHKTANGERFEPHAKTWNKEHGVWEVTGAHRSAAFNTRFMIRDEHGNPKLIVRINDRGPAAWTGRSLDINEAGAEVLGFKRKGTIRFSAEVV